MASFAARSAVLSSLPCLSTVTNMTERGGHYRFVAGGGAKPGAAAALPPASTPHTQEHAHRPCVEERALTRRSGSKRDRETAAATDVGYSKEEHKAATRRAADRAEDTSAPARKHPKVTY
ncbi:protein kinase, partial [Trypanosoma conorhini]